MTTATTILQAQYDALSAISQALSDYGMDQLATGDDPSPHLGRAISAIGEARNALVEIIAPRASDADLATSSE